MQLTKEKRGECSILLVHGRLDGTTSPKFETEVLGWLSGGGKAFVLDMAGISFMSSAALRVLLSMAKRVARTGGKVVLSSPNAVVSEVFEISNFSAMFTICTTLDEGVSAATQGQAASAPAAPPATPAPVSAPVPPSPVAVTPAPVPAPPTPVAPPAPAPATPPPAAVTPEPAPVPVPAPSPVAPPIPPVAVVPPASAPTPVPAKTAEMPPVIAPKEIEEATPTLPMTVAQAAAIPSPVPAVPPPVAPAPVVAQPKPAATPPPVAPAPVTPPPAPAVPPSVPPVRRTGPGKLELVVGTHVVECRDGDVIGSEGTVATHLFKSAGVLQPRHILIGKGPESWFVMVPRNVQVTTHLDSTVLAPGVRQDLSNEHQLSIGEFAFSLRLSETSERSVNDSFFKRLFKMLNLG